MKQNNFLLILLHDHYLNKLVYTNVAEKDSCYLQVNIYLQTKSKRRLCTQASKKVGCPCHITIRHVMLLPDFKVRTY